MKNLITVTGDKGGIGKTLVTIAAVDWFIQRGEQVLLVDGDGSNPDSEVVFRDNPSVVTALLNLNSLEGWSELATLCDRHQDAVCLVDFPARGSEGVFQNMEYLQEALEALRRRLITLWVLGTGDNGLNLLSGYLENFPPDGKNHIIHVLKNGKFGPEQKFARYNESERLRPLVASSGGKSLLFPELRLSLAESFAQGERPDVAQLMQSSSFGERLELSRWRKAVSNILEEIL